MLHWWGFGEGFDRMVGSAEVAELSVGLHLLALLSEDGKVTAVLLNGQSEEGQERRGGDPERPHRRLNLPPKERVQLLSCGKGHVVLVSDTGTVREWSYTDKSNTPRSFSNLTERQISHVACGNDHSAVLTKDGQLFTWGENSKGQLGLGKNAPSPLTPQPVKSLYGIPLAQISSGGDHSFALSLSGTVFAWGRNSAGQLGLGDREDRYVPAWVKSLNLKRTVFISCGEDHTAVLTKGGLVFTFGSGCYGQLGHNSFRDELRPRLLGGLWGSEVSQIACGRHHTLALVHSKIYAFGCGEQGQLGNGQCTNQCVPLTVHLLPERRPDQRVDRIIAGGNLSVACCATQDARTVSAGSSPGSCEGASVLDDELIEKWISNCEQPRTWRKLKREIKRMFSAASFINGSFIDKRDKHYETSEAYSGLDLSLARCAFEKLATKRNILLEVESTVERDLLPSLENTTAAGVEALRVYLILPELLRVLRKIHHGTQLTIALASCILKLDQESLSVLKNLWTRLPYYYYSTAVKVFRSVASHFISRMTTEIRNDWADASPPLSVLQTLHDINGQRTTRLTDDRFYIKEINVFFASFPSSPRDERFPVFVNFMENVDSLLLFPFILEMRSKRMLFKFLQTKQMMMCPLLCPNALCVNRKTVLMDTFTYLKSNMHDFCRPIKVKFIHEDGYDAGGLRAEFFTLLGQDLREASSLIQANEHSGLFWFSADTSGTSDEFYYLGVICGMAFYNHCFLNIGFPLALFKKLQHQNPTLSDLEELSPVEARGLKDVLTEEEDVVEGLLLDFTLGGTELVPNGQEIAVTKANRRRYVDLYVDYFFNKSVERQFKEFENGFNCGNFSGAWTMFLPEELRLLLYGTSEYEWEELQRICTYEGCEHSDVLIQNFWKVFFEFSEELQKKFLVFMYATDRLPVGGLSQLRLKIVRHDHEDADERFPVAQTCFGILDLPNYSDISTLQTRLAHAITHCEIFGKY